MNMNTMSSSSNSDDDNGNYNRPEDEEACEDAWDVETSEEKEGSEEDGEMEDRHFMNSESQSQSVFHGAAIR